MINKNKKKQNNPDNEEEQITEARVRFPKKGELFGIIESRLGCGRMNVICSDGKTRIGRVPGKFKRRLWLREADVVIIKKWEFQGDKKGDVLYKYRKSQIGFLKKKNYLKSLNL
ncbi:MAG: translation initiation factor eIF-1A [Candidatus Aenigmarchaeota archaeon ex4484_52]|nr:MAG: translation initiation factor eIF-1A [Candidatus Aenigmarchaeota archaeon ex4484_52]